MSVFVHAQGIKIFHAGGEGQKWLNSVHVVIEWPLKLNMENMNELVAYLNKFVGW